MSEDPPDIGTTYDRIAGHFAETRSRPWPEIESFLTEVPSEGEFTLDIGVGNGRHAALLAAKCQRVCGVDRSRRLLAIAERRSADWPARFAPVLADAAALPLDDGTVDIALYIATIHHLPTRSRRQSSLAELARVLRPGAPALVSAWGVTHDRFERERAFDDIIDWTLPDGTTVPRFYHIYDRQEFVADVGESPLIVDWIQESSGNYYARVTAIEH